MKEALSGADAVIFAVRHAPYIELVPEKVVQYAGKPVAVIDCFGMLDDWKIRRYFELGCEVKGLGRGHVKRIKIVSATRRASERNQNWKVPGFARGDPEARKRVWVPAPAPEADPGFAVVSRLVQTVIPDEFAEQTRSGIQKVPTNRTLSGSRLAAATRPWPG